MKIKGMKEGTRFKAIRRSEDTAIVIALGEYRHKKRLDIRLYFRPYEEFIPTKKGVSIREEDIPEFLAAVANVIGDTS